MPKSRLSLIGRRGFVIGGAAGFASAASAEALRPKPRPRRGQTDLSAELTQLLGARIMVGFVGQDPIDDGVQIVADQIARGEIGGVILLQRNLSSPDQVAGLTAFLRQARPDLPPLIAVDNEGGKVQRAGPRNGFAPWVSAAQLGQDCADAACAQTYYAAGARQLRQAGITLNFGPVVDLAANPDNPVIAGLDRAFDADPDRVAAMASGFVQAHRAARVATCLKHFPGHGSTGKDSHHELPDISADWSDQELLPYRTLIAADQVDMVMMGHLVHPRFSEAGLPASLSVRGVTALRDLGFFGPVTSDDLQMEAIAAHHDEPTATRLAAQAGLDMLLFNTFKKPEPQIGPRILGHLRQLAQDKMLDPSQIKASHDRLATLRKSLI